MLRFATGRSPRAKPARIWEMSPGRALLAGLGAVFTLIVATWVLRRALTGKRRRRRARPGVASTPTATLRGVQGLRTWLKRRRHRSGAQVLDAWPFALLLSLAIGAGGAAPARARLLVPMDEAQTDHLKAYGLTYWVLTHGQKADWLLNYRGGSFLLPDDPATEREVVRDELTKIVRLRLARTFE